MATNNDLDKIGEAPIGSIARYDFTAPANTGWLLTNGAAVSKTTYAPLYALAGNGPEGTGVLTEVTGYTLGSVIDGYGVAWHPSSNYVACTCSKAGKELFIASFNGTTLSNVEDVNLGGRGWLADWHPNGNFLAIPCEDTNLRVFSWNGTDTLTLVETVGMGYWGESVSWHPGGSFLAVSHSNGSTDEVSVYSWNGSDTLAQVERLDYASQVNALRWSPDGNYLALGSTLANHEVDIYTWNGSDTLTYNCAYIYGTTVQELAWSPNGLFLAIGGYSNTKQVAIVSFDGSSLTERATKDYGTGLCGAVSWSRGGNYLLSAILLTASTVDCVFLNTWVASSYTLTQTDELSVVVAGVYRVAINYTNNYFAYIKYGDAVSPYNFLRAGTTGLTVCDYATQFPLPITATSIIRAK
jgi:WD40 repeat protein